VSLPLIRRKAASAANFDVDVEVDGADAVRLNVDFDLVILFLAGVGISSIPSNPSEDGRIASKGLLRLRSGLALGDIGLVVDDCPVVEVCFAVGNLLHMGGAPSSSTYPKKLDIPSRSSGELSTKRS
jgi:hypothetical protein